MNTELWTAGVGLKSSTERDILPVTGFQHRREVYNGLALPDRGSDGIESSQSELEQD
jgi:hypothetical protein